MEKLTLENSKTSISCRSVRIGLIGLGQAGGAIAKSFADLGYEAIAFNTSESDLRTLDLPDDHCFVLSPKFGDGAGRDRETGGKALRSNAPKVLEITRRILGQCDRLMVCGGLAGGTGGNLGRLAAIIAELGLPVSALGALPFDHEGTVDRFNAAMALYDLSRAPLNGLTLIQNSRLLEMFPDSTLEGFLQPSNDYIAREFDSFNRINRGFDAFPLQSFDGEDFRRILSAGGVQIFASTEDFSAKNIQDCIGIIERIIRTNSPWPQGFDLGEAKTAGLILTAPKEFFRLNSVGYWGDWMETLTGITRGCGCYFGLFEVPEKISPRISVIFAGLPFPEEAGELIESVKLEARLMKHKLDRDSGVIDTAPLEKLILFPEQKAVETIETAGLEMESGEVLEPVDSQLEEIDVISMGREGAQTAGEIKSMEKPEGEEIAEDEAEYDEYFKSKRSLAPFIVWPLAGILVIAVLFIVKDYIPGWGRKPAVSEQASGMIPSPLISVPPPGSDIFYILIDKSAGKLNLYNSQPILVKSYPCWVNTGNHEESEIFPTPTGVYFAASRKESESGEDDYEFPAFNLNYPNPMDSIVGFQKAEITLEGIPITPQQPLDTGGGVLLSIADMLELSNFIRLQRTPVIIENSAEYMNASEIVEEGRILREYVTRWNEAWDEKNPRLYFGLYAKGFKSWGRDKSQWLEFNRDIFKEVSSLKVDMTTLQILDAGSYKLLVFELVYKSQKGSGRQLRRLYLERTNSKYNAVAEEILPISPK